MKLQYTNRKRRSRVDLRKDEKCPLGISITENQKDTGRPVIKSIKHGSVAYKSHSLAEGDVIISVNGKDTRSMRKKDIKCIFKDNDHLDIEVEYLSREASFSKIQCSQRTFLTLKKESGSFGFLVRKDVTEYPLISNIKHDGPADKDGSVLAGDRLLEVDNQSLSWISLAEVTTLLQSKDEAVFLIEYSVGLVNLPQKEVEIVIDCPDTNLGMAVDSFAEDPSRMLIASIRQGSLIQRCGAFHVGDEIISIDGTEVKGLSTLKVNDLLRRFKKKPGKLKFVHCREKSVFASQESLGRNNSRTESTADLGVEQIAYGQYNPENNTYQTISTHSLTQSKDSLSSSTSSLSESHFFDKVAYGTEFNDGQLKVLSILRYLNLNITSIHLSLSQAERNVSVFDISNSQVKYASRDPRESSQIVKTKNSLPKLKADCLTLKNLTRELSFHYIKNTAHLELSQNKKCNHSKEPQGSCSNKLSKEGNLVVELVYNLNEIMSYNFIPKTPVKTFIEAIDKTNIGCSICRKRCYLASFAVRKVLLLLSLNDQTSDSAALIRRVLSKVTDICLPCEECKIPRPANADSKSKIGNFCLPRFSGMSTASSNNSIKSNSLQASTIKTQSCETSGEPHVGLDLAHQKALYRLTDIQSSEKSHSTTTIDNVTQRHSYPLASYKSASQARVTGEQKDLKINVPNSSNLISTNQQDQSAHDLSSSWKSTEILSNLREELEQQFPSIILPSTAPRERFPTPEAACTSENTIHQTLNSVNNRCSSGFEFTKEQLRKPELSVRPKFTAVDIPDEDSKKTHTETHNVKLKANGSGCFGFTFGYDSIPRQGAARIPVITAIKPKSPAGRIGLLKIGDRVLEMNGRSVINCSIEKLERLKQEIFSLNEVILKVEFDVNESSIKSGTFELNLEEHLKPGLVMDIPYCPSKVKGLVKGGAAYRSGQVFPGDIILSFGSVKHENIDLQSWTRSKKKSFHLVVRRRLDNYQVVSNETPEYICDPVALVRKGTLFTLKRTSVRTIEGHENTNKVFLEQEFTLYRDPRTWDFGFLFGEDPRTGRAFIKAIRPLSPAHSSKVIKENDRILEVNGVLVDGSRENSVINLVMNASDQITLVTRRLIEYR